MLYTHFHGHALNLAKIIRKEITGLTKQEKELKIEQKVCIHFVQQDEQCVVKLTNES